jgi:hypothetical protein
LRMVHHAHKIFKSLLTGDNSRAEAQKIKCESLVPRRRAGQLVFSPRPRKSHKRKEKKRKMDAQGKFRGRENAFEAGAQLGARNHL